MPHDDAPRGDSPRRYSDTELSRLLKVAAELQQSDEGGRSVAREGGGMTLATLQKVAAEAGIEPRYVQLAAARIRRGLRQGLQGWTVNHDLAADDSDDLVARLERALRELPSL